MNLGELMTQCVDQAQEGGLCITIITEAAFFQGLAAHHNLELDPRTPVPLWIEDQMRAHWRDRLIELRKADA